MTYDLIYDKQTYQITFDDAGVPCEVLHHQLHGPALVVDLSTIPTWLLDKLQQQWQVQHDYEMQQMRQDRARDLSRPMSQLHRYHA